MDYQKFFEESTVAFCRTEVKTGKFVLANQATADLLGLDLKDLKENCRSADLYPAEMRQNLIEQLREKGAVRKTLTLSLPNKTLWILGHFRLHDGYIDCILEDISEMTVLWEAQRQIAVKLDSRLEHYDKV
jgi:hypothetical protein